MLQDGEDGRARAADGKDVRLLLAVNKADLLPPQATPVRLEVGDTAIFHLTCLQAW